MSIFSPDDYKRESKKQGGLSDKPTKKARIPTNMKSIYVWCRNCNCKNTTTRSSVIFFGTCKQCGVALARASKVKLK